jgi:phosphoribosylformylglycinamidine synthase PurS subunit
VNEKMPNKQDRLIRARVMTKPKKNTLDPQGIVVKQNLEKMGIEYIDKISIGRYIEIAITEGPEQEIKKNVQEAVDKLLHNSIIEDYEVIYER